MVDATDTFSWTVATSTRSPIFDQDVRDQADAEGDDITASTPAPPTPTATR